MTSRESGIRRPRAWNPVWWVASTTPMQTYRHNAELWRRPCRPCNKRKPVLGTLQRRRRAAWDACAWACKLKEQHNLDYPRVGRRLLHGYRHHTVKAQSPGGAGAFVLDGSFSDSLNGESFQQLFLYSDLKLFNYYYRVCTCSTTAGLRSRRQACRGSSPRRSRLSTASAEATRVAPSVKE